MSAEHLPADEQLSIPPRLGQVPAGRRPGTTDGTSELAGDVTAMRSREPSAALHLHGERRGCAVKYEDGDDVGGWSTQEDPSRI